MEDKSYYNSLNTGVSDGTQSGDRGLKENYRRKANIQTEANALGENLTKGVVALFLHPVFCFVGFWMIGFGLLLALPQKIGMAIGLSDTPTWYAWSAAVVPVVVAYLIRKILPKLMAAVLIAGIVTLVVLMYMKVKDIRSERAAKTGAAQTVVAPAVRAPAPRTPTPAEIQRALIEAANPEITSTPPSEGPVGEISNAYCAELPDFCTDASSER